MASTKTRRPPPTNVIMSTPPPRSRNKVLYSETEKEGLLENFDIEVAHKSEIFRSILARTLVSFRIREESEILKIPRELRKLTLAELESKWGGGWANTLKNIRRESFDKKEKVREENDENKREELVKGKRKRNGTNTTDNSPERGGKNPRRDAPTPSSSRKAPPSSTTRSKASTSAAARKGKSSAVTASSSKGPSTLPQNHIFNPTLPPTPLFSSKANRPLTSPLSQPSKSSKPSSNPPSNAAIEEEAEEEEEEEVSGTDQTEESEDEDDDENELPDPEKLEAQILSAKTPMSKSSDSSFRLKKKRGPSLIFRQSLAPGSHSSLVTPLKNGGNSSSSTNSGEINNGSGSGLGLGTEIEIERDTDQNTGEPISNIILTNGRIISFNPFDLSPGRVDKELNENSNLTKAEIKRIHEKIQDECIKSLKEKMEKWTV
ncbi:uncharacterized protein L201_003688 [Kwoniella dendrophila CBS 6074]|uniref:Borealin N-terminal domain-containing protein n=1 Tax=Kwoniella dendrophila CBS 6074 TaxID=1295534 RepID=A0AAX4JW41_9TREE